MCITASPCPMSSCILIVFAPLLLPWLYVVQLPSNRAFVLVAQCTKLSSLGGDIFASTSLLSPPLALHVAGYILIYPAFGHCAYCLSFPTKTNAPTRRELLYSHPCFWHPQRCLVLTCVLAKNESVHLYPRREQKKCRLCVHSKSMIQRN